MTYDLEHSCTKLRFHQLLTNEGQDDYMPFMDGIKKTFLHGRFSALSYLFSHNHALYWLLSFSESSRNMAIRKKRGKTCLLRCL